MSCLVILNEIQGFLIANERCKDEVKTSKNSRTVELIFYQFVLLILGNPRNKHENIVAKMLTNIIVTLINYPFLYSGQFFSIKDKMIKNVADYSVHTKLSMLLQSQI